MDKPVGKDPIEYAVELDLLVSPEQRYSVLEKSFGNLLGSGIPLFSVGGGIYRWVLYQVLLDFHVQRGYKPVMTPHIASAELSKVSGHYDFYKDDMYIFDIDGYEYFIKPMNCPFHVLIFANTLQRYRDIPLPFKIFEPGVVYRYELSGSIHALLRPRGFTQDDAHIFTPPEYLKDAILTVFHEMKDIYTKVFHLPFSEENIYLRLSMGDPGKLGSEFIGTVEEWANAEDALRAVAEEIKSEEDINYREEKGEAAFYGPKLDVVATLGPKEWQIGTIQFDFNLPRRFKLVELVRNVGAAEDLYMVHRAYLGSIERFLGVYLEFTKGRLPFILNPVQVAVYAIRTGTEADLAINNAVLTLRNLLTGEGIRAVAITTDKTSLGRKVRKLETTVRPSVQVFIGEKDIETGKTRVKYYVPGEGQKEKEVAFASVADLFQGVMEIIRELEASVEELTGKKYRLPVDVQYMV